MNKRHSCQSRERGTGDKDLPILYHAPASSGVCPQSPRQDSNECCSLPTQPLKSLLHVQAHVLLSELRLRGTDAGSRPSGAKGHSSHLGDRGSLIPPTRRLYQFPKMQTTLTATRGLLWERVSAVTRSTGTAPRLHAAAAEPSPVGGAR